MNEQALKQRLRYIAKESNKSFQDVWKKLILERLLVRIAKSKYHENFIFKGGLLLAYYVDIGRETKDADFLATKLNVDEKSIEKAFRDIFQEKPDDGFSFNTSKIEALEQPHMEYTGYRLIIDVRFQKMLDKTHVDIGIGDIVEAKQESLELYKYRGKPIYEDLVSLQVYPIEAIFAEKLETIISKGAFNSRMKDFHDLLLLTREEKILNIPTLQGNIIATFKNRKTTFTPIISFSEEEYEKLQTYWNAHLRGLADISDEMKLPNQIKEVIKILNSWIKDNISES